MKHKNKKVSKITKGMPSAVLLSIMIHAALFLLAGMLVVFTVVKKEEKKFVPPKAVERPKMKLRKPKVKVKKTSRPRPTTRIVTKVNRASMPDIQLPEMSGMGGEGLGGSPSGFDLMPDLSEPTLFGAGQSIGNDFVGIFYDFKRDRTGRTLSVDISGMEWRSKLNRFFMGGWDTSAFTRYYRAEKKLYATNFMVPITLSALAPAAFGDKDAAGALWAVHYKGQLVCPASHTNGITFRFWAMADEFLAVRVNGEPVLAMDWLRANLGYHKTIIGNTWKSDSSNSRKYIWGNNLAEVGDWITLKPAESLPMEVIFGDNGGVDCFFLAIEEQGVEYERTRQGAPFLPAFKTAEFSHKQLDLIYKDYNEDEICLTNGPVFCDYITSGRAASYREPEQPEPVTPEEPDDKMRSWTLLDGHTLEAEFINIFGDKVVLKNASGKIKKVLLERFSAEDIEYVELESPPVLDINFMRNFRQKDFSGGFYDVWNWQRPPENWGRFGVQLKQTSAGEYDYGLEIEMFVVGQQRGGRDTYILLDRQKFTFNPAQSDQRFQEFISPKEVVLEDYADYYGNTTHGEKYIAYLVTITDERGKMIKKVSPKKWLIQNMGNLKKIKVGNYMDKTCRRTYPERPGKSSFY